MYQEDSPSLTLSPAPSPEEQDQFNVQQQEGALAFTSDFDDLAAHRTCGQILNGGCRTFFRQFKLLMLKDLKMTVKSWFATPLRILLPTLCLLIVYIIIATSNTSKLSIGELNPVSLSGDQCTVPSSDCGPLNIVFGPPGATSQATMDIFSEITGIPQGDTFPSSTPQIFTAIENCTGVQKAVTSTFSTANVIGICFSTPTWSSQLPYQNANPDTTYLISYKGQQFTPIVLAELLSNRVDTLPVVTLTKYLDQAMLTRRARVLGEVPADEVVGIDLEFAHAAVNRGSVDEKMVWLLSFPAILCIGMFATAIYTVNFLNSDRKSQLRQGLMMMGLQRGPYLASVFVTQSLVAILSVVVLIIAGYAMQFDFFIYTNPVIILLYCIPFALCVVASAMTIGVWFHHPIVNVMITILALLTSVMIITMQQMLAQVGGLFNSPSSSIIFMFMYQAHFGDALALMNAASIYPAGTGASGETLPPVGFSFANMTQGSTFYNPAVNLFHWTPLDHLWGLLLCMAIGPFLAWFIDNVSPGKNGGYPKKVYFFLTAAFWGLSNRTVSSIDLVAHDKGNINTVLSHTDKDLHREYEYTVKKAKTNDPTAMIKLLEFSKSFTKGGCCSCGKQSHRALDNLTLTGDQGTVLCLLGHNGAGKTTTINMLTGLFPATTGDAFLLNRPLKEDIDRLRTRFGVCPQHDILWPHMTPDEHLRLIGGMKGLTGQVLKDEMDRVLLEVNLVKQRKKPVGKFSGGMKRRLSVGMAQIGNPPIVFLDEPTTGLDPKNRIALWKVIERMKKGRLVVLTSHSMEEVDALADKVCILALGRMRAVGTPAHLKNRFGVGYHIDVVTKTANTPTVKADIAKIMPNAVLTVESAGSLTYSLSNYRLDLLQKFFVYLEQSSSEKKKKGYTKRIEDWVISHTTLEEVFLRLTHGDAFTFDEKDDEAAKPQQLCAALESDPGTTLGFAQVHHSSTLREVREKLGQLPQLPIYQFVLSGVPVNHSQEDSMFASDFLPLVLVRPVAAQPSSSSSTLVAQDGISSELTARLTLVLNENATLKEEVRSLKKENKSLRAELAAAFPGHKESGRKVPLTTSTSAGIELSEGSENESDASK